MAHAAARPRPTLTQLAVSGLSGGWSSPLALRARGAVWATLGAALIASFASYRAADPSLDVASDTPARNVMGRFGATVSDAALQSIGLAAWVAALLMVAWGFRRAGSADPRGERRDLGLRALAGLIGVLVLAGVLAAPAPPSNWPLARGLGGVWGDSLLRLAARPAEKLGLPVPDMIAAGVLALLALPALGYGAGVSGSDFKALWTGSRRQRVRRPRKTDPSARPAPWRTDDADLAAETVVSAGSRAKPVVRLRPEAASRPAPLGPTPLAPDAGAADLEPPFDLDDEAAPAVAQPRRAAGADIKVAGPKPPREAKDAEPAFEVGPPLAPGLGFQLPELAMLAKPKPRAASVDEGLLRENARALETVLAEFGVKGQIDQIRPGPVVTLYELVPAAGVKSSRVIALSDDIARSMSARACRVSVVSGRNAIGIELPNADRETVYLRDLLSSSEYAKTSSNLPMALGETIGGDPYIADLSKMPHLLIAGTTGSGKSVGVNAMILSILYRLTPEQCRFIMIDPKMLELSVYDGIPHLLAPVVTDPKKAIVALKWTVREMENRYRLMSKIGVRNVGGYNDKAREAMARGEHFERTVQTGFDDAGRPVYESEKLRPEPMPYLVVVIDEVADLMMVAGKDIEGAVQRLAQMARAAGIHLIMATQRPSVDVITGTIKANFPTRISFQVTSKIDARTILGEQGAEQLLGQGDMLYMAGGGRITRLHGPFVSDQEVEDVAGFLRAQGQPNYLEEVTAAPFDGEDEDGELVGGLDEGSASGNELYDQAVAVVTRDKKASTSYVQRRLQIGYNRAASLIERMEREGVVGPANHAGKREIFAPPPPTG